jgi:hypothetical protein
MISTIFARRDREAWRRCVVDVALDHASPCGVPVSHQLPNAGAQNGA